MGVMAIAGAFALQVAVIMALNHPEATRVGGLGLPFEDLITLPSEAAKQLPISDPGAVRRHSRESGQKLCAFSLLPLEELQDVPHVRWVDGQPCLVRFLCGPFSGSFNSTNMRAAPAFR